MVERAQKVRKPKVDLANLPPAFDSLTSMRHWCGWRWLVRNGKRTKPPYRPIDPTTMALSNKPKTWGTYKRALEGYEAGDFDGIGFQLMDSGLAALDLDDVIDDDGELIPWAQRLVDASDTYVEVTVSGKGLRIIGRSRGGEIPTGMRKVKMTGKSSLEIYRDVARFICVTGNVLHGAPDTLGDIDGLIETALEVITAGRDTAASTDSGAVDIDALPVPARIKALINGEGIDADRSRSVWAVTCALVRAGVATAQIETVLAEYPIGEHCRDQGNPARYITGQIEKAREKVRGGARPQASKLFESQPATEFKITALDWLWQDRFALGKIGLIAGLPERGKGLILADMIARITRGKHWPCGEGKARKGNVIVLDAEDDASDTIVPRLKAAGADLSRVHFAKAIRQGDQKRMFNLIDDIESLRTKIEEIGDVVAVFIDPITSYLGVKKTSGSTFDIRAILAPVKDLAGEMHVAVIAIMHFNKATDVGESMLRISDSLAFVGAARHTFIVADDKENDRRLFCRSKNNLAPDTAALSYTIPGAKEVGFDDNLDLPITAPYIEWGGAHVDVSANEAMQAEAKTRNPNAVERAETFLLDFLEVEPKWVEEEIKPEARDRDISWHAVDRARSQLIKDGRLRAVRPGGNKGPYQWELISATEARTTTADYAQGRGARVPPRDRVSRAPERNQLLRGGRAADHDRGPRGTPPPGRRPFTYRGHERTAEDVARLLGQDFYRRKRPGD